MGKLVPVSSKLGKAIDISSTALVYVAGVMMLLCVLSVFYGVVMRYVFHAPVKWVLEVSVCLFVWFSFLAMPEALKTRTHVRVDLLLMRLSPKMQGSLEAFHYLLCSIYGAILMVYGVMMVMSDLSSGNASMMAHIPVWIVSLSLPLSMFVFSLQSVRMFISQCHFLRTTHLPTTPQLRNNPLFIFPLVTFALIIGLWLLHLNPFAGVTVLFLSLLAMGTPVGASLGLVGCSFLYFILGGAPMLRTVAVIAVGSVESWVLLAAPFFIFLGTIIHQSNIAGELFEAIKTWVGRLTGCLGVATIGTSAVFAAMSGTSAANAAALANVCVPRLVDNNYNKKMATGAVVAGGTLGMLIPPSLPMIIYGSLTDESVGELFIAGLIPGIILALMFAIYIWVRSKQTGQHEKYEPLTWGAKLLLTKRAAAALIMPVIVLGSIYSGVVTPTEAAALSVVYALVVSISLKKFKWRDMGPILVRSAMISSMMIFILIGAMAIGNIVAVLKIPQNLSQAIAMANIPGWFVIVLTMLVLLILGMFLEGISITLLTIPIMYPLIVSLGFNPVWFAVLFVINGELGCMTPPVGFNLYVVHGVTKVSMTDIIRGSFPFMILILLGLILVALVPQVCLWLPSTM